MSRNKIVYFSVALILFFIFSIYFDFSRFEFYLIPGIIISIVGLYLGGDIFLEEAVKAGKALKISGRAIGIYLISTGAIIDEIFISLIAAARGDSGISFGTIQGSNIVTLLIFLVIVPLIFTGRFVRFRFDALVLIVLSLVSVAGALIFNIVPREYAIPFLAIFFLYLYLVRGGTGNPANDIGNGKFKIIPLIISIALIILSSDEIVTYTQLLSQYLHVQSFVSGFLITGVAGSLPELIMVIISLRRRGGKDITTGIITGSTVYKSSLVLGLAILFGTIGFRGTIDSMYFMMLLSFILLFYTYIRVRKNFAYMTAGISLIFLVISMIL